MMPVAEVIGTVIDPSALISEYVSSACGPKGSECEPPVLNRLLDIVCAEFASRYGVRSPCFLDPLADNTHGFPALRDGIRSSGPEEWAWALSGITPGAGDRERGAVSTLPSLARFMCRLAIEEYGPLDETISIADPAVGGGAFVLAMASELAEIAERDRLAGDRRAWALGRICGVDVEESCLLAARASAWLWWLAGGRDGPGDREPPRLRLYAGDSLLEGDEWWSSGPGRPGSFDILVANPPYVRQELVGAARKAALAGKYEGLGGRTDMYARFFVLAARLLRPGGVAAFLTPVSWMDVAYGATVKRFILDNFDIRSIVASGETRWFPQASINAQITVLRRRRGRSGTSPVRFVNLGGGGSTTVTVPQASLGISEKWGTHLRAPRLYFDLMKDIAGGCRPGFCRLLDLARVSFGTKTGANGFFYMRDAAGTPEGRRLLASIGRERGVRPMRPAGRMEGIPAVLIEEKFLRPVVKSLRDVKGYRVDPCELDLWAFAVGGEGAGDGGGNSLGGAAFASAYVRVGAEMGYSSRPTCGNRKPWYRIPEPPADMLYSMSWGSRLGVALNETGCLYDARLYGISARDGVDPMELAAALNATCTWLFTEVNGRQMTGSLPLLDIKIYEVERLPVLDVRRLDRGDRERLTEAMSGLLRRDMFDITTEVRLEDRRRLDEMVLRMAGYGESEAAVLASEIGRSVADMVERRISKSGRVLS